MIFVNGATDTPGCIAGAVASGSITYGRASALCAVGNFFGTVISCTAFPQVARTVASLADLPYECIAASLLSAIVFSSVAWMLGIPTSESHGLIASLGGAALFLHGRTGIGFGRVIFFSFISCVLGAVVGFFSMLAIRRKFGVRKYSAHLAFSAFAMSFCHGAQDGQKFAAILALAVSGGGLTTGSVLISALLLGLGCFFGGRKMINKLGGELAGAFCSAEALASDSAAFACCVSSSLLGIPVSTTYMKTFAMIGAARAEGRKSDRKTLSELIVTWVLTYPVCMTLSFVLCAAVSGLAC